MRRFLAGLAVCATIAAGVLTLSPQNASAASNLKKCMADCQHGDCSADSGLLGGTCTCTCNLQGLPTCSCT